jgi:hypothetical protein
MCLRPVGVGLDDAALSHLPNPRSVVVRQAVVATDPKMYWIHGYLLRVPIYTP